MNTEFSRLQPGSSAGGSAAGARRRRIARGGANVFGRTDAHSCASSQQLTPPLAFPYEIHSDNGQYCELCNA